MDVSEILATAWREVEAANLPENVRGIAFGEAIRLVDNGTARPMVRREAQVASTLGSPAGEGRSRTPTGTPAVDQVGGDPQMSADEFFRRLAEETGVVVDKLERVLQLNEGIPRLNLPGRRLGPSLKQRMEAVAIMITVARSVALDESETKAATVRAECARLKSLDQNFSTYVSNLPGILYTGPTSDRIFRVRPQGLAAFSVTIDRVLGSADAENATEADE